MTYLAHQSWSRVWSYIWKTALLVASASFITERMGITYSQLWRALTVWFGKPQDNLGLVTGYAFALVIAFIGFLQWRRDQRWKRLEHVFDRISAFGETPGSINAMMMLGAEERNVALWDHGQPEQRWEMTTWSEIAVALIPENEDFRYNNSPFETAIRDSFADFFGRLAQVDMIIEQGIVTPTDVEVIVRTWVSRYERIPESHPSRLARAIRLYLDDRGDYRVQRLFARYGVDLGRGTDPNAIRGPSDSASPFKGISTRIGASKRRGAAWLLSGFSGSNLERASWKPVLTSDRAAVLNEIWSGRLNRSTREPHFAKQGRPC